MPFPFVAVTLPDDTPPAYVAGLLSACTQAYPEGTCRTAAAGSLPAVTPNPTSDVAPPVNSGPLQNPSSEAASTERPLGEKDVTPEGANSDSAIVANITWANPTTALLQLGLPHWRNHRWVSRTITFKEHDQPVERYRALGFTIGSLSVTVGEVARLEQEARESEKPPPAAAVEKPTPAPAPPTAVVTPRRVGTGASEDQTPPSPLETPSHWFLRGYLAGELGEGFDAVRRGGTLGVGLYGESWGGHVSGYYTDASGNGLQAAFSGVELKLDLRVALEMLEAQISIGGGYGHLDARITKEASQDYATGVIAVNVMPAQWVVAPFVGVGARVFRGFVTDVAEFDHLGPITPYLHVGVALGTPSK